MSQDSVQGGAVANNGILVDMIIQNAAQGEKANISFTVPSDDVSRTVELLTETLKDKPAIEILSDSSIGKLSVVGIGLRSHTDVGAKMFQTLADHSINVEMVNTSELKVSVVVSAADTKRALEALRDTFSIT